MYLIKFNIKIKEKLYNINKKIEFLIKFFILIKIKQTIKKKS